MKILPHEIAFDIDGVVADTFRVFVEIARRRYGYSFGYEDITEYEFMNIIDIDEKHSEEIIQSLLDAPVGNGIEPLVGAVRVLTRLSRASRLLFVTARPDKDPISDWISRQLPDVSKDLICIETTTTHSEKIPILLENRVKYFVEDRLETGFLLERVSIVPIIFDQPWNRRPHGFTVVRTWEEIAGMIDWDGNG